MSDKPKESVCEVLFDCDHTRSKSCAYYVEPKPFDAMRHHKCCEYEADGHCYSSVAQTNAMVLALKDMGFEVELKGGKE